MSAVFATIIYAAGYRCSSAAWLDLLRFLFTSWYYLADFSANLSETHSSIAEDIIFIDALRQDLTVDDLEDERKSGLVEVLPEAKSLLMQLLRLFLVSPVLSFLQESCLA